MKNLARFPQLWLLSCLLFVDFSGVRADEDEIPREIRTLNDSYAREIARVLPPIQKKYIAALERLLEEFTRDGALENAILTKRLIEDAKNWNGIPLDQFRVNSNIELGRSEFEEWLQKKTFSFQGVSAVILKFGKHTVEWRAGGRTTDYEYRVRGKRTVIIEGSQNFEVEFTEDLLSGTFESDVGKYPLTIED